MPLAVNTVIASRFQVKAFLGEGAHAEVYRAYDGIRRGEIALKVFDEEALDAVTAELASQFQVSDCPAVMPIYDVLPDVVEGPLTVMPIAASTIADEETIFASRAIDATQRVLTALEFCHGRNVIHGDVKPANIFVTQQGSIALGDFGVADFMENGRRGHTLEYASPEQVKGHARTPASDVWAAAAVAFELLCGELPFGTREDARPEEVAGRIVAADYAQPTDLKPYLPRRLRNIFRDAFVPDPADRPLTTPGALRDALADVRIATEWIKIRDLAWKEQWEGHQISAQGARTGTIFRAGLRERPRKKVFEAVLTRDQGGGGHRQIPGVPPREGSEKQARQRLYTWLRKLTADEDPRD